jgi:hypothetical protein
MASHESPRTTKFCNRTKDATLARPRNARLRWESYPFDADYGARRTFEFRTKRRCIGSLLHPSPRPLSLRPLAAFGPAATCVCRGYRPNQSKSRNSPRGERPRAGASDFIPLIQLGTTDDCGFSPFGDDLDGPRNRLCKDSCTR